MCGGVSGWVLTLGALAVPRYILPEGRIVQVKARQVWSKPTRKLASTTAPAAATGCTGEPAAKVCEASGAVEESKDADAGCPTVVGKK